MRRWLTGRVGPALTRRLLRDGDDVVHAGAGAGEELLDVPRGLADAVLVLDQRDAHEALAVLAEAQAGRYRDVGLLDQQLGELHAAELPVGLGDRCPREHRGQRRRYVPARARKALDQAAAAALV